MRSGLVIVVRDLARSQQFYSSVLGMDVTRTTRYGVTLNTRLALEPAGKQRPAPPAGLILSGGLTVTLYTDAGGLQQAEDRLREAGVPFFIERGDRGLTVRTADPDGVPVELARPPTVPMPR